MRTIWRTEKGKATEEGLWDVGEVSGPVGDGHVGDVAVGEGDAARVGCAEVEEETEGG